MAQTRAMTAGRRSAASIPAAKTSKPAGITKKKKNAVATTKPKPKTAPVRTTTTTKRTGKRKASEIEDEAPAPAPRVKRAKATPVAAKPTNHRYGTRSKAQTAAPPPPPPSPSSSPLSAVSALPPALLSPSPEREPGQVLSGSLLLSTFVAPFSSTLFSGARLSPLVVERGCPLSPPELSEEKKLRTLSGFRFLGKQERGSLQPILEQEIGIGYLGGFPRVGDTEQDPRIIQARLEEAEEKAYWVRENKKSELSYRREQEAVRGYEVVWANRNQTKYRLNRRTLLKRWSTPWKKQLIKVRRTELLRRAKLRQKWEMHRVHDHSPLTEDCSAALEEEARLLSVHEQRALARERFAAEVAAGDVDDADEYGDDYDPFEEDY
ncbi:uncharacterized protein RSE6_12922 [Rhynchosporium secalis]|uniref:Uncharacterized protein n=1 Tax=Rhynchosporium secalis TaxID=38038 RepID=A0A1E1MRL2_RHYSE|nr:uncharacterized protein RSE6_12922 [Rhynchosporium secalis]